MPVGPKAQKIKRQLHKRYGPDRGERIFHAMRQKGKIKEDMAQRPTKALDLDEARCFMTDLAVLRAHGVLDLAADSMMKASTPRLLGTHPLWFKPGFKLPDYIEHVASHFIGTHGESQGIAMAIGIIKNWASGRPSGGEKSVHPDTVAAAQKALAEWEALKARAKSVKSTRGFRRAA